MRIQEEVNSSFGTPTYSPPLTPMLGCTLADKMTSTMPMMNHSFRTVANTPMLKPRGRTDRPAGSCQTAGQEFTQLSSRFPGRFSCHTAGTSQEQLLPDTWTAAYRNDWQERAAKLTCQKTLRNAENAGVEVCRFLKSWLKHSENTEEKGIYKGLQKIIDVL